MCGRFTLRTPAKELARHFDVVAPETGPRFNIAPSQDVPVVRLDREKQNRELAMLYWGLVPFWADDPKTGYKMINARAETVAQKPAFRRAFSKRRCLIPADGFYEWKKTGGRKQPFLIHIKDDRPFAFAGLWEHWKGDQEEIESCTIIVTEANELLRPIHDRMPVILAPDDYDSWLDPEFDDTKKLERMMRPYPPKELDAYPVSTTVNNPRNDTEKCAEPVEAK